MEVLMMDDATKKSVEFIIYPYSWGVVQDAANLILELLENSLQPSGLIEYVREKQLQHRMMQTEYRKEAELIAQEFRTKTRRCVCGNLMNIFQVNHHSGMMVGGNWKSMWQCSDSINCGEYVMSELSPREEMKLQGMKTMVDRQTKRKRSRSVNRRA